MHRVDAGRQGLLGDTGAAAKAIVPTLVLFRAVSGAMLRFAIPML